MAEITAESIPQYDVPFFPFDEAWDCQDWKTWHKKLKEKYGPEVATQIFIEAWQKQGFWEWNRSFCKYDSSFVDYFQDQGLDPHNFVSRNFERGKNTLDNVAESAENLSESFTRNTVFKVLGAAGILGLGYYFLLK